MTNSKSLAEKMMMLRSHGVTRDPNSWKWSHGPWYMNKYYWAITIEYSLEASLGLTQLKQIDKFVKKQEKLKVL